MLVKKIRGIMVLAVVFALLLAVAACDTSKSAGTQSSPGSGNITVAATATTTGKATAKVTLNTAKSPSTLSAATSAAGSPVSGQTDETSDIEEVKNTVSDQSEIKEEQSTESGAVTEKSFDLKGRKITLLIPGQTNNVAFIPQPNTGNPLNEVRWQLFKEAERKFNFTWEVIPSALYADLNQKVETAFISGTFIADAFRTTHYMAVPKWEKMGLILPINDYIDFELDLWKQYTHFFGLIYPEKIYAMNMGANTLANIGLWYNKEILDREGISDLYEYLDKGAWNWNMFIEVAIKTTKDFDGNGIVDQWGVGGASVAYLAQGILYSNKGTIVSKSADTGKFVYNLDGSNSLKAMQLFSDLYNTYKVAATGAESQFKNNKMTMFAQTMWYGTTLKGYGLKNICFISFPFGPDNTEGRQTSQAGGNHSYFYPVTLDDPEAVVNAIAYWTNSWDESKPYYLNRFDRNKAYGELYMYNQNDKKMWMKLDSEATSDVIDYVNFFGPTSTVVNTEVFTKAYTISTNAASAIMSIKSSIQDTVNEAMRK